MSTPNGRFGGIPSASLRATLLLGCALAVFPASGAVINLTNSTIAGEAQSTLPAPGGSVVGGIINGALYRRPATADDSNAGSGIFRDLYRVSSNSGAEEGYNRAGVMDSSVPNGFDPIITLADLVEDSTGLAYVFVIDTNEAGNTPAKYISLDDFRIYVGGPTAPSPLPQDFAGVESDLGLNVYSMNETGQDNTVLLDYSLFSGSGQMDMFVFVPKALFAGLDPASQVYVYSRFGGYTGAAGFDPSAGSEQVSLPGKAVTGTVDPLVPFMVPEPGVSLLALLGGLLGLRRRRR